MIRIPRYLLREVLELRAFAGSGSRGPVFSEPRDVRARVESATRLMTDPRGEDVTVEATAMIRPEDAPVTVESLVGWNGQTYRVVQAMPVPDTRRPSHWELSLSRTVE